MPLIELEGVEKRFGDLRALRDVSLKLEPGRIGLLAPNGAAKSTFLKSLLKPEHGHVQVFGQGVSS